MSGHPLGTRSARGRFNKAMRAQGTPAKVCGVCGVVKGYGGFNRRNKAPDGRQVKCKACTVECRAKYRADHHEEISEYNAKYHAEHREEISVRKAKRGPKYHAANTTRNADFVRNIIKVKRCGACHVVKSEVDFSICRARADSLQDRCKPCVGSKYVKIARRTYGDPTGHVCYLCDQVITATDSVHVDHLIARSHGGKDVAENLRYTHGTCNVRRNNRPQTPAQVRTLLQICNAWPLVATEERACHFPTSALSAKHDPAKTPSPHA